MGCARYGCQQLGDPVARDAAEPQVAADRPAHHSDGAGAPVSLLAKNKASDRGSRNHREVDGSGPELLEQKPADNSGALMARICCQTFDILHVSVEPNQLAPNRILRPDATDDDPIRSKHFQQSCECRPVLMDETPCRIGTAAAGQMLR